MGDRTIHIKHLYPGYLEELLSSESKDTTNVPANGGLCAAFCVAEKSEQAAYDEANLSSEKAPVSEDPEYIETCEERHKDCFMCGEDEKAILPTELQRERLTFKNTISVLAVCRSLYEEGLNTLWQSNTFSFDDPESFKAFVASMNLAQKSKFRKLHISMKVAIDRGNYFAFQDWAKVLSPRVLTPLKNLKILHLSIDQYSTWEPAHGVRDKVPNEASQHSVSHDMKTILGFRMLPWKDIKDMNRGKHITVIIGDDVSTHSEAVTPRWSKALKLEAAEAFRLLLTAPNSAEIHQAGKIATAECVALEKKQARINKLQSAIDELRPKHRNARLAYESRKQDEHIWSAKYKHAVSKDLKSVKRLRYSDAFRTRAKINAKKLFDKKDVRMKALEKKMAEVLEDPEDSKGKKISKISGNNQDSPGDDQDGSSDVQDNLSFMGDNQNNSGDDQDSSGNDHESSGDDQASD